MYSEAALPYLNFDYNSRFLTVVLSIFGIISNILHFSILIKKSLRTSPVFIFMAVISICDIFQLSIQIFNDISHLINFKNPHFCLGYYTYWGTVLQLLILFFSSFFISISNWFPKCIQKKLFHI
ncbi:Protein CBG18573 [Caenorhabditis briggsae]|uniref:Protein CBG18573 n=1 Tax=Caenorhabditis briggsae TaxID=6238 RepID=A8XTM0_CAEBR|nr:Protein CBG18573 [Caenorhabditis briggsae]CAP35996.1 Protein CBG18573 [Caenorhabditis briggsae]